MKHCTLVSAERSTVLWFFVGTSAIHCRVVVSLMPIDHYATCLYLNAKVGLSLYAVLRRRIFEPQRKGERSQLTWNNINYARVCILFTVAHLQMCIPSPSFVIIRYNPCRYGNEIYER